MAFDRSRGLAGARAPCSIYLSVPGSSSGAGGCHSHLTRKYHLTSVVSCNVRGALVCGLNLQRLHHSTAIPVEPIQQ